MVSRSSFHAQRAVGVAVSVATVVAVLASAAGASGARDVGAVPVPPPSTAASDPVPYEGPDPEWAVPVTGPAAGAVDVAGTTYLTSATTMLRTLTPTGAPGVTAVVGGSGSLHGVHDISSPAIAVGPTSEVLLAGQVTGTVTIGSGPSSITLVGGTSSSFVLRLTAAGAPVWGRTFAAGAAARVEEVAITSGIVAVAGEGLAAFSVAPFARVIDDDNGFVVGLDLATGTPAWITEVDAVDPVTGHGSTSQSDLAGGHGTFAWYGSTYGDHDDKAVRGPTTTEAIDCTSDCDVLVGLDAATGEPVLATPTRENWDIYPSQVAVTDDGYVILEEDRTFPGDVFENARLTKLDATGDESWRQDVRGAAAIEQGRGMAVDGNGDIVLALAFGYPATFGEGPEEVTVEPGPHADVLVVEYDEQGRLRRHTVAQGLGGSAGVGEDGLAIDGRDIVHLVGSRTAGVEVGTGSGAITVPGTGTFVATFRPDAPPASSFVATAPTRLLDSRTPTGGWSAPLLAAAPRSLTVAGVAGVPADATAVVLNLTATDVSAMTFLTAWPTGRVRPTASNVNAVAGDTIANQVTVAVGTGGRIDIATAVGSTNVVADLYGYYVAGNAGDRFHAVTPSRLLDSRTPTGGWNATLDAGAPRTLTVAGTSSVPADATTAVLAVTVTDASAGTFLRVEPAGASTTSSNLNIDRGETITNLVTTRIGAGGALRFTTAVGSVNVVADVVGYYRPDTTGALFHPIVPLRVLDSRNGTGVVAMPWGPGTTRDIVVWHVAPVDTPPIVAITGNLTATDTSTMSFATLYPEAPRPGTSSLIWHPGQTIASAATTGVGPGEVVSLYNQLGSAHLILDVSGYFVVPA